MFQKFSSLKLQNFNRIILELQYFNVQKAARGPPKEIQWQAASLRRQLRRVPQRQHRGHKYGEVPKQFKVVERAYSDK